MLIFDLPVMKGPANNARWTTLPSVAVAEIPAVQIHPGDTFNARFLFPPATP
ncbi:hypothetical protein ACPWT1_18850 [Ramlibacter sp. MMS24-I3-19]|uniref:hypothetical protein n=1 Tax=Ramlibacter sp. MMS24-I3-19 TaxID=3416606 RepID=UPI003CFBEA72